MAGFLARISNRSFFSESLADAFVKIGPPDCYRVYIQDGVKELVNPDGSSPRDVQDLQALVNWLQCAFGPAFDVHWRTPNLLVRGARGGLIVERLPSMTSRMNGRPTTDGQIMIPPGDEPEWLSDARMSGWDLLYDRSKRADGSIGVSYTIPKKVRKSLRWPIL